MKHVLIVFLLIFILSALPISSQTTAGYIIGGQTRSYTHGSDDFLVYRINARGTKQWRKNYGGRGTESGGYLTKMAQGTFALAGSSIESFSSSFDCIVYKLTDTGKIRWRRVFGTWGDASEKALSISRTTDGGYVVGGFSNLYNSTEGNNGLLVKLNGSGNILWWHLISNTAEPTEDWYNSVHQTADGGYIISTELGIGTPDRQFCIDRMDENGYRIWQKRLGGTAMDFSTVARQTADGGYIAGGCSLSFTHGNWDFLVYKLDRKGKKQWRKNYGGDSQEILESLEITSDGGYILVGHGYSYSNGSNDILVYKIDGAGRKQWRKNYGGFLGDSANAIKQTSDGGYILSGSTMSYNPGNSDILVYKLDRKGKKQWRKNYGGSQVDYGVDIIEITQ